MTKKREEELKPLHIMLVEDSEHDILAFERACRKSDLQCTIVSCQRAEHALEELTETRVPTDLIVSDYNLPGMTGIDFFQQLEARSIDVPFIMLTGTGSEPLAVRALKSGVDDYLIKDPYRGYLDLIPVVIHEVYRTFHGRRARRRAEEALRTSEERFRSLAGLAQLIPWEAEMDSWKPVYIGSQAEEILGFPLEQLYEEGAWSSHVHEADRERFARTTSEHATTRTPYELEYRMVAADGGIVWLRDIVSVDQRHDGKAYLRGFSVNITARMRAENNLRSEKERLAVTLRSIGDGVISTDTAGQITLVNRLAEKLTGWTRDDAVGKAVSDVFVVMAGQKEPRRIDPVADVMQDGGIRDYGAQTVLASRDGIEYAVTVTAAPIHDQDTETIGVVIVFHDVTDTRRMEDEIMMNQKLESVGILAGGIAHDFNNLLVGLLGNLSLAKMLANPEDKIYCILERAENASRQSAELTQRLLTFATGGAPVRRTTDVRGVLRDTAEFTLSGSRTRGNYNIEDKLWHIDVDCGQFVQVLQNLIINSLQATPDEKPGTITVSATNHHIGAKNKLPLQRGRYVAIKISDEGAGIPQHVVQKIFDPFFTTKAKGHGLGLSTAYSITHNHDGYIAVSSKVDVGTTFTLYFPAVEESAVTPEISVVEEKAVAAAENILLMDDEAVVRDTVRDMLSELGYEVTCVANGDEAISTYRNAMKTEKCFDLVILDLTIRGGIGGDKVLNQLKEIDPGVKSIVSSGYSQNPILADYAEYGFLGMVQKPFRLGKISTAIRQALA